MKSKQEALISRGYIEKGAEQAYLDISFDEKTDLLQSKTATNRTLAARLLAKDKNALSFLIKALCNEKKLYTKIEICNSLVSLGEESVKPLIVLLGKIGNNQHKSLPKTTFKKNSYPLPRDIAARTLAHIGIMALPELLEILKSDNQEQLSEAIDAIGYICFYSNSPGTFPMLIDCYHRNRHVDIIKWKIIRAMSAFPESNDFLNWEKLLIQNRAILNEIDRSLKLIAFKKQH